MSDTYEAENLTRPEEGEYNALVHFNRFKTPLPGALYITRDDILVLNVWNPSTVATSRLTLRYLAPDGSILPRFETFTDLAAGGATPVVHVLQNAEGMLLSATVETPGSPRGQTYVALEIIRGLGTGDLTRGQVLCAGYPGTNQRIAYPGSPVVSPLHGRGWFNDPQVTNPGAGLDWTFTVPAGEQWILEAVAAQLATSATVANRTPVLQVTDVAGNVLFFAPVSLTIAASQTGLISWFHGSVAISIGQTQNAPIPFNFRLQPGWHVRTVTVNLQAGDVWSNIFLSVERFIHT